MQLTRTADYAVRVMIPLAILPDGHRASRDTLASWTEVPAEFLGKVLQSLARARLIVYHRGSKGGFALVRAGSSISVLEITEAIEGPLQLNACLASDDACARQPWCPAHGVWKRAQAALAYELGSVSLHVLAAQAPEGQAWR